MKPLVVIAAAVSAFVAFLLLVPQSVVGVTGVVVGGGAFAFLVLREVRLYLRVRRITSNRRPGELPLARESFMEDRRLG